MSPSRRASGCCCRAVRAADAETLILADGFSCREQIEQGTGRKTLHAAELAAQRLDARFG